MKKPRASFTFPATLVVAVYLLVAVTPHANAAITTGISQAPGAGGNVDFTASTYISWGYYAGGVNQPITNLQSGDIAPSFSTSDTFNAAANDYGWTFDFNDGTSIVTGTSVVSSGSMNGIGSGEVFSLTFADIVSATETRTLTLFLGAYAEVNGTDSITETITSTLTGGSSDEMGEARAYTAYASGTNAGLNDVDLNTTDANGIVSAIYTIEFTSLTETDLVLSFTASDRNGTAAMGVSGYSLAVIPEPSTSALLVGAVALGAFRRRRK